eukprot:TRINITY_DN12227_c0_g1_i4.p1 TRINITY_DN12227_c0_g1~~TRINITY_DN12227_c0_g1_i4.p1  ORF type:complete len:122 (+),score=31.48 TRINITY_DN12227_c0_g1_i4:67-432(+)
MCIRDRYKEEDGDSEEHNSGSSKAELKEEDYDAQGANLNIENEVDEEPENSKIEEPAQAAREINTQVEKESPSKIEEESPSQAEKNILSHSKQQTTRKKDKQFSDKLRMVLVDDMQENSEY